ncbi:MAG: ABC transporter permease, partial [Gammaproteobacteria bacterium]|nr:ABC transporter permease [Gammaproteobacteria bacterium]
MKNLLLSAQTDIVETLRARWVMVYSLIFGGLVVVIF